MSWTDERIGTLKKMWKEGKSAADIAKTLGKGVTRNAVIGKAHRMGLSGRPSPIKKPVATAPKKEKELAPKKTALAKKAPAVVPIKKKATTLVAALKPAAETRSSLSGARAKEAAAPRPAIQEAPPSDGGVALIDLSERMCKWPYGDPQDDDFTFCGRAIRPGTPYCPDHAAQAYQTSTRSRTAVAYEEKAVEADEDDADDAEVEDTEAEVDED